MSFVELSIYNLIGQKVATVVSEIQPEGYYNFEWDGGDYASGIYFYRIAVRDVLGRMGVWQDVKKMILLR